MIRRGDLKPLTKEKLDQILVNYYNKGYTMTKWIQFCLCMLDNGFDVRYYAAQTTVSKYIYVKNPRNDIEVKVRFSNHEPNLEAETKRDSDFYIGRFNNGVITTEAAIPMVIDRLEGRTEK